MKLKIFIAQKMNNMSETNVMMERRFIIEELKSICGDSVELEIIDNWNHPEAPENAGRLWHLGRSIQQLEKADFIVFANGCWLRSKGCFIEKVISIIYKIPLINIKKEKKQRKIK